MEPAHAPRDSSELVTHAEIEAVVVVVTIEVQVIELEDDAARDVEVDTGREHLFIVERIGCEAGTERSIAGSGVEELIARKWGERPLVRERQPVRALDVPAEESFRNQGRIADEREIDRRRVRDVAVRVESGEVPVARVPPGMRLPERDAVVVEPRLPLRGISGEDRGAEPQARHARVVERDKSREVARRCERELLVNGAERLFE